jgi:hypothetical protein
MRGFEHDAAFMPGEKAYFQARQLGGKRRERCATLPLVATCPVVR